MPENVISIITIFWNAEAFIEEAIQSVLAQHHSDWELIFVDDGSTDRSKDIALKWVNQYPEKMRYFIHPGGENRGMSASRNLGIRSAHGDYISFLDADDVWRPSALSEQSTLLKEHPQAGLLYGATEWWYSWTGKDEDARRDFVQPLGVQPDQVIDPPLLLLTTLPYEAYNPAGILWRREVLEEIGGYEEQFRGMFEDQACYAKALINTPVYVSSGCWYRYRKHPQGCCGQSVDAGRYARDRALFLAWLKRHLRQCNFHHRQLKRVIDRELIRCRYPHLEKFLAFVSQKSTRLKEILRTVRHNNLLVES